jgi:DnaJ-class molecular chaperone
MTKTECCRILEITKPDTVTEEQAKSAFRVMAMRYHPDHNKSPDANKQFIKVKDAYDKLTLILKNPTHSSGDSFFDGFEAWRKQQDAKRRSDEMWENLRKGQEKHREEERLRRKRQEDLEELVFAESVIAKMERSPRFKKIIEGYFASKKNPYGWEESYSEKKDTYKEYIKKERNSYNPKYEGYR